MRIAFTYNVRHASAGLEAESQAQAEFDEPETIAAIHAAIEANGHSCLDVEADDQAYDRLRAVRGDIDLVFNIAEGSEGTAREAHIPAMLEILGIPVTHSSALTHAVCLDKALTKKIFGYHRLANAGFVVVRPGEDPGPLDDLRFPVLVKPNGEGSSKGLLDGNLVEDPAAARDKIREVQAAVGGKVLVEEFLPGRELTVTLMGNPGIGTGLRALPMVEQNYDVFPEYLQPFASYEAKWFFEDSPQGKDACVCPAVVEPELRAEVERLCVDAYVALECRDVARIDVRLDADGRPNLLEINTLPGMHHDPATFSYFPMAARAAGWDYTEMIGRIIEVADERLRAETTQGAPVVVPDLGSVAG